MVLKFKEMEDTVQHEAKGGKGDIFSKLFADDMAKIMIGRMAPGCSIGFHQHEDSCEMIYILEGEADFLYDEGTEIVRAGECQYCPKGHWHSMRNNSDRDILYFAVIPKQ